MRNDTVMNELRRMLMVCARTVMLGMYEKLPEVAIISSSFFIVISI
jgi:hypothetical protein